MFHCFARNAALVAGYELRELSRTRRTAVLVVLYLLIALATSWSAAPLIRVIEQMLPDDGGAHPAPAIAGDEGYRSMLLFFAGGDPALVDHLATYPAMVVVFVWVSLAFLPWFIALTGYDHFAGDVYLRTIRYSALRTTRGAYVVGKLVALTAVVAAVAALGMLPVFVIGAIYLPSFDLVTTLNSQLVALPITLVFALASLGVVSLASQLCGSPATARVAALGSLALVYILPSARHVGPFVVLSPWHWKPGLLHPDGATRLTSVAACLGLCVGYSALGYLRFRRRDL